MSHKFECIFFNQNQIRRIAVAGVVAANHTIRHALLFLGPGREEEAMAHFFAARVVRGSKQKPKFHQGVGADGAKFKFKFRRVVVSIEKTLPLFIGIVRVPVKRHPGESVLCRIFKILVNNRSVHSSGWREAPSQHLQKRMKSRALFEDAAGTSAPLGPEARFTACKSGWPPTAGRSGPSTVMSSSRPVISCPGSCVPCVSRLGPRVTRDLTTPTPSAAVTR